jgi:hypothetical protein
MKRRTRAVKSVLNRGLNTAFVTVLTVLTAAMLLGVAPALAESGSGKSGTGKSESGSGSSGSGSSGSGSSGSGKTGSGGTERPDDDDDDDDNRDDNRDDNQSTSVPQTVVTTPPASPAPTTRPPVVSVPEFRKSRTVTCGHANLELSVRADGRTIRVTTRLRPEPKGTWEVTVVRDRVVVWKGKADRGRIDRSLTDLPGAETLLVRLTNSTGTLCTASITIPA